MEFTYLNIEYLFLLVYNLLFEEGGAGSLQIPREVILFWDGIKVVSTIVSLLLLTGIVYTYIRLSQIRKDEKAVLDQASAEAVAVETTERKRDERWERVLAHMNSENQNDWRQAIIEADTILDDIVTRAGYPGETLGERMRGIEKSDFRTLDEAWEAHKVRNRIAHDGQNYQLTKREALRVIDLYRKVFEEFYYI